MRDNTQKLKKLLTLLSKRDNYIITTHIKSDADGIGAELSLSYLLTNIQKTNVILNPDEVREKLKFIDTESKIKYYDSNTTVKVPENPTVVIVDNSDIGRIGDVQNYLKEDKSNLIVIDHHNELEESPWLYAFPEVGSTSEIIFELLQMSNVKLNYDTAVAIYMGILMDTGQFRYNKTRPRTHEIAAKLLEFGFPTEDLSRKIFENTPIDTLYLKRDIYSTIVVYHESHFVTISITREMLDKYNFTNNPSEHVINDLLGPADIYMVASFTELDNGKVKISLRSKGNYNICSIAKEFSGGGHTNAAGATVDGNIEDIRSDVVNKLVELYNNTQENGL